MSSVIVWPRTDLDVPSRDDFLQSADILREYVNNKRNYADEHYQVKKGEHIGGSFRDQNRRREYFLDCEFDRTDLCAAGFSGAVFRSCVFNCCKLDMTNMNECKFEQCTFVQPSAASGECRSTNFAKSIFWNCSFANCHWEGAHFEDTVIIKSSFSDCLFSHSTFENARLIECDLKHVRFKSMNLEFCHFDRISAEDLVLPFPSIPFVFGATSYLYRTADAVFVTSAKPCKGSRLTAREYGRLLPSLEAYYSYSQAFFPLVNVLLAQSKREQAGRAAVEGIRFALTMRDYRMVRYHCMQISKNALLTKTDCKRLYDAILQTTNGDLLSPVDGFQFEQYRPMIEAELFSRGSVGVDLLISTPIKSAEDNRLGILVQVLETCVARYAPEAMHSITLRHCCPFELFMSLWANIGAIAVFIKVVLSLFESVNTSYQSVIKSVSDTYDLMEKKHDHEKRKSEGENDPKTLADLKKILEEAGLSDLSVNLNVFGLYPESMTESPSEEIDDVTDGDK